MTEIWTASDIGFVSRYLISLLLFFNSFFTLNLLHHVTVFNYLFSLWNLLFFITILHVQYIFIKLVAFYNILIAFFLKINLLFLQRFKWKIIINLFFFDRLFHGISLIWFNCQIRFFIISALILCILCRNAAHSKILILFVLCGLNIFRWLNEIKTFFHLILFCFYLIDRYFLINSWQWIHYNAIVLVKIILLLLKWYPVLAYKRSLFYFFIFNNFLFLI